MIALVAGCWLGVALVLAADPARARRMLPGLRLPAWPPAAWRGAGVALLLASSALAARAEGLPLALVAVLLATMAAMSFATLLVAVRPRLYAASAGAALVVALASLAR